MFYSTSALLEQEMKEQERQIQKTYHEQEIKDKLENFNFLFLEINLRDSYAFKRAAEQEINIALELESV